MMVVRNIEEVKNTDGLVATIGFFDGVHRGHRFLIHEMMKAAHCRRLPTAVVTFPQHPRMALQGDYQPKLLNSFDERLALLAGTGIDYCILVDFTPELAQLTAEDFISILSAQWRIKTLFIGYDHRFGHNREDGFEQYVQYAASRDMAVLEAARLMQNGVAVSSSEIRKLLALGQVETATQLLTYPYQLKGCIVPGNQIGRTIGFPTANIRPDEPLKLIPATGVYAVQVKCRDQDYKGMLYIGRRPTLNPDGDLSLEVHILDFQDDIYTDEITVSFLRYLRRDTRFHSLEELKKQLEKDALILRSY
jgi:riboflavin kinase/FMN adenylyltransferase